MSRVFRVYKEPQGQPYRVFRVFRVYRDRPFRAYRELLELVFKVFRGCWEIKAQQVLPYRVFKAFRVSRVSVFKEFRDYRAIFKVPLVPKVVLDHKGFRDYWGIRVPQALAYRDLLVVRGLRVRPFKVLLGLRCKGRLELRDLLDHRFKAYKVYKVPSARQLREPLEVRVQ
jgi:hypothetical protein